MSRFTVFPLVVMCVLLFSATVLADDDEEDDNDDDNEEDDNDDDNEDDERGADITVEVNDQGIVPLENTEHVNKRSVEESNRYAAGIRKSMFADPPPNNQSKKPIKIG